MRSLFLILVLPLLSACGAEPPKTETTAASRPALPPDGSRARPFIGRGVITEIRGNIIQIDHETIPGFMAAVTMDFPLDDPVLKDGLRVDQTIGFAIERTNWDHRIIQVYRTE